MTEKEFDNIIKQKLESIQDEPPAYMWDKVATAMPASGTAATTGMALWVKTLLVASVVIALIGGVYLLVDKEPGPTKQALAPVKKQVYRKPAKNTNTDIRQASPEAQAANLEKVQEAATSQQQGQKANGENIAKTANSSQNTVASRSTSGVKETEKQKDASGQETKEASKQKSNEVAEISAPGIATAANKLNQGENEVVQKSREQDRANSKNSATNEEALAKAEPEPETETPISGNETKVVAEEGLAQNEVNAQVTVAEEKAEEKDALKEKSENKEQESTDVSIENPKFRVLNKYSIGLHYGPEFISLNDMNFTDQGVDLSFNYQNLKFIFQTGAGVRFSQDRVNYDMRYKKWEYLETQIRFDSATFVIDANGNPVLVPVNPYYEDVYDSVQHDYYSTAKVNYTILQIPLNVGYQIDRKYWGFYVKGGIRYSLIVYQNTKGLLDPGEGTHLEYLNYPEPARTKSNIDYELALGLSYRFTNRFSFQLEGFGRLYQYSIFNEHPPSGDHPLSYSVRAGLTYLIK